MSKWRVRKLSMALVLMLLVSALAPIGAYAYQYYGFSYNTLTGMLSGAVYTKDPSAVQVTLEGGAVTDAVYTSTTPMLYGYDSDNEQYISVVYSVYAGPNLSKVTVTEGSQSYDWTRPVEDSERYRFSFTNSERLDAYRMQGEEHISSLAAGSYIPAGSDLYSFTPEPTITDSVYGIEVGFPYAVFFEDVRYTELSNVVASDFVLTDTTVTESVYITSLYQKNDYTLILQTEQALVGGHDYTLKLSSSSGGDEVHLPSDNWRYDTFVRIGTVPSGTYLLRQNSVHFDITYGGTENPHYPEDPSDEGDGNDDNDNPGNSNGNDNQDQEIVNEESLKNAKNGKVAVTIANGKKQVLLPANAAKALGKNSLVLESDELSAEIPSEVLSELEGLLGEGELEDAQISFDFNEVAEEASEELLGKAKGKSNKADLKIAGQVYDFTLAIVDKEGKEHKLDKFSKKIKLTLEYNEETNTDLAGVYYISEDGDLEFVGGQIVDGKLVAEVGHFSTYAVLEYEKQFDDVASTHWAADVIKSMAAKHVVNGTSDVEFQPEDQMTRAEFTAVIVRALGLEATGTAAFDDVAADAWYAGVVAAASEAGLVNGKSATTFVPEGLITREEMVTIVARAYAYKTGESIASEIAASFDDRDEASDWAQASIDAAVAEGLVKGKSSTTFAPKELMTRAEGAQIAYTLYTK